jgi:hypothetical protein
MLRAVETNCESEVLAEGAVFTGNRCEHRDDAHPNRQNRQTVKGNVSCGSTIQSATPIAQGGIVNQQFQEGRPMKHHKLFEIPAMMVVAFITVMALSGAAFADYQNLWSTAGAGCVPVGQTSSAHLVFNSAGDAGFVAGRLARLFLPVPLFRPLTAETG